VQKKFGEENRHFESWRGGKKSTPWPEYIPLAKKRWAFIHPLATLFHIHTHKVKPHKSQDIDFFKCLLIGNPH